MTPYACFNRAPYMDTLEKRDHHGALIAVWPFAMARDCRYTLSVEPRNPRYSFGLAVGVFIWNAGISLLHVHISHYEITMRVDAKYKHHH